MKVDQVQIFTVYNWSCRILSFIFLKGKSTLGSLLLRLYDPASGSISIGGMEIANMDEHQLRRQIGTVSQEPVLFSSSIRENILYGSIEEGKEGILQSVVEECAREANAHNFISDFPEGYETLVGERGILLSGGQKQRIAIARAIIRNPKILILDEATRSVNPLNCGCAMHRTSFHDINGWSHLVSQ